MGLYFLDAENTFRFLCYSIMHKLGLLSGLHIELIVTLGKELTLKDKSLSCLGKRKSSDVSFLSVSFLIRSLKHILKFSLTFQKNSH